MQKNSPFYRGKHIVSARDFDRPTLEKLFQRTGEMKEISQTSGGRERLRSILYRNGDPVHCIILHDGPSTRTISSFDRATKALGGNSLVSPLRFSSIEKGESFSDTAAVLGADYDTIVIRADKHPGVARVMANAVDERGLKTIVINAGDGPEEHPTQMLVDLFTIWRWRPISLTRGALTYALVGDLARSRTIHSLLLGLKLFGGRVFLVGPANINIPQWLESEITCEEFPIVKVEDPLTIAPLIDVWYFTRLQTNLEGSPFSEEEKIQFAQTYGASIDFRKYKKKDAIILHPLPHDREYSPDIDLTDNAFIHFPQAHNGRYIRMALLEMLLT